MVVVVRAMTDLTEPHLESWITEVRNAKQREAEFERALWARIWLILSTGIGAFLIANHLTN